MAYATTADVQQAVGGAAVLTQLADFDGTLDSVAIAGVVDAAVAEADALIDTYASKRFKVPFASPSLAIRKLSARLAARFLRRDRRQPVPTDADDDETDRKWLDALARGLVSPGTDPFPQQSSVVVDAAHVRASTKNVSRERLKGYW